MKITPDMATTARESIKLSQSRVAKETGINRAYLSQFETGRRVLEDHWLEKLWIFYTENGWKSELEQGETPEKQLLNNELQGLTISDGFVISALAIEGLELESLLDEYYELTEEIEELKSIEFDRGLFGTFVEQEAVNASIRPLVLMARQCEIKRILQGQFEGHPGDIDREDNRTIRTAGDYIEALMMAALPNRVKPGQEPVEQAV